MIRRPPISSLLPYTTLFRSELRAALWRRRALPRRGRRTVGAWCFADHIGPELVTETSGLDIGPHPHTGLHTVTWLVGGEELRSEEHTSELQSRQHLVCRLLL